MFSTCVIVFGCPGQGETEINECSGHYITRQEEREIKKTEYSNSCIFIVLNMHK